ncbi:MAG: hypothetical protein ABSC54_05310 [Smithellaceae bacterium]|jgi:hypothetical protein
MREIFWDLLLVGFSSLASAGTSWFFSRMYYRKSLANQEIEVTKERAELIKALKNSNANDQSYLTQQYIDGTVMAWKEKGSPFPYLDSLTEVSREQKSQILRSASLRHKGREPKRNLYAS